MSKFVFVGQPKRGRRAANKVSENSETSLLETSSQMPYDQDYEQGEWRHLKVYKKGGRASNTGAGKKGGKNGSINECQRQDEILDEFRKDGFIVESISQLTEIPNLPKGIVVSSWSETRRKRRLYKVTRLSDERTFLIVKSAKYSVEIDPNLQQYLYQTCGRSLKSKQQETDLLIIDLDENVPENRKCLMLETSWQDVEGNAIDRQYGNIAYKFKLIRRATQNNVKCMLWLAGPVFDFDEDNNVIHKGVEWYIAKYENPHESIHLGDNELSNVFNEIKQFFLL